MTADPSAPEPPEVEPHRDPEPDEARLSRRQLMGGAAATGAALALPGAAEAKARAKKRGPTRRSADVVVVGAGLAGLVAARALRRAGKRVIVMEARGRAGGRCYSRELPGTGDVANLGATFVGPTQHRILGLAHELGIGPFPTYNTGRNVLFFNGRRDEYTGAIPPLSPVALIEVQKAISQLDAMARSVPLDAPWRAARAAEWDSQTFDTWKRSNIISSDGRKLLDLGSQAILSIEPRDVSLLFILFYIHSAGTLGELINTAGGAQETRIEGGTQKIADELAKRLNRKRVLLKTPVRRIVRRKRGGVDVVSDKVTVRAKRVIVAVPPTIAGRIRYEPGLPGIRDQLTQRVPMGSVTKTFAVYDTAFWREDGLTGQATSDTGTVRVTFDGSPRSGRPGVLLGFVDADDARALNQLSHRDRASAEVESYVRYFGPKAAEANMLFDYPWDNDRLAGGAPVGFTPPGVLLQFGPALRDPVGPIHWSGTETATVWNGYMDGAVQSGQRVAREVLAEL